MTEPDSLPRNSAGGLLRAARERQGLHIAALAAAIKVTPRKLDALERDRYDELPDPAFTRALAQAVCRSLKIDAAPVLALLPPAAPASLEHVAGSLNTPFRERPGREDHGLAASAIRPLIWASGVLMLAAVVVMFLPDGWWGGSATAEAPAAPASVASAPPVPVAASAALAAVAAVGASAADAASAVAAGVAAIGGSVAAPASAVVETVFAAPPPAVGASAVTPATVLAIRVSDTSWIEVQDGRGTVLLSRSVQPGESVGLDGALPLRLTVGNAAGTQLVFRGQPVDLSPSTRDNVARLELK
jgi:cytoskeleton protein RodZ